MEKLPPDELSATELKIFRLYAEGKTHDQIADIMGYVTGTVNGFMSRACMRLNLSREEIVLTFLKWDNFQHRHIQLSLDSYIVTTLEQHSDRAISILYDEQLPLMKYEHHIDDYQPIQRMIQLWFTTIALPNKKWYALSKPNRRLSVVYG